MNVLVSVIVPIYNVDSYLSQCIESIIHQTYPYIEIILVNDGSTDNCENICIAYANKDNRIRYFYKKNGGLSSARNYGIKKCRGEYFCFIDSDDFIDELYVEKLLSFALKNNCDITICGYKDLNEADSKSKIINRYASNNRVDRVINNRQLWEEWYLNRTCTHDYASIIIVTKLFKRSVYKRFKFKNVIHEDEFAAIEIYHLAKRIGVINDCLYIYRRHRKGSITDLSSNDLKYKQLLMFEWSIARTIYFIKNNYFFLIIDIEKNRWIENYFGIPKIQKLKYWLKIRYLMMYLSRFDKSYGLYADRYKRSQFKFLYKLANLFVKARHFIRRYKKRTIYVCDTYFHVLCTCAKAINSNKKVDIAVTNNISGCEKLKERLINSNLFNAVYVFDNKTSIEISKSQKLNNYFHGIKQIKIFRKRLPFSLYWYKKIFLYNDWTQFSKYLKDLRKRYNVVEDGIAFYQTFRNFKGYPYYKKSFKQKLIDIIFPYNINHYNYHDKSFCVKSIEVDHVDGNMLDKKKKIIITPKKELFKCFTLKENLSAISKIFDIDSLTNVQDSKNVLLFGNCLYIDKIESYENIYSRYEMIASYYLNKGYNVFYKAHPRENKCFSIDGVINLNPLFPSELILYTIENKISLYIGIATSSVLMFPKDKVIYFLNNSDVSLKKLHE